MRLTWLYLVVAIVAEVLATSALKATHGFTKPLPALVVVVGYGLSFYFLALVLRSMPVGVAYAVWSGLGTVLVAVVAAIAFKQVPDWPAILGMALIVAGVVVMNVFSSTAGH